MICFQISLNGRALCLAGVGGVGSLDVIVETEDLPDENAGADSESRLTFNLFGGDGQKTLEWFEEMILGVGDVLEVQIIESTECDPPISTFSLSEEEMEEMGREAYLRLKEELG